MMTQNLVGNWNYPTRIHFGAGRATEISAICRDMGMQRPLIITDSGLVKLPPIAQIAKYLDSTGLAHKVFSDLRPNPQGEDVDKGVAAYKAGGHDGIVAVGGGSAIDVAKAVALMVGQSRPLWDFEDVGDNYLRVNVAGMAPVLAVPTTAGTGSEVGRASVIIDAREHRKVIIFHANMLPARVLADPELTAGLPPHLTAATGIDALVHNLEAYLSPFYHPIAQGVGLEGIKRIHDWLPTAYADGANIQARAHLLAGSIMGATAFQKGLGGVHALAHPIGGVFNTHHGLANAILLPYVLERNRLAIEPAVAAVARYLGLPTANFDGFMLWLLTLRSNLKIPHRLSDIGIDAAQAPLIANMAKADPSDSGNPCVLSTDDYQGIFENAVAGTLRG